MINKKIVIKDDYGIDFEIIDLISFKNHLTEYHTSNGEGNNSLHTENGRSFTITKEFYKMIQNI